MEQKANVNLEAPTSMVVALKMKSCHLLVNNEYFEVNCSHVRPPVRVEKGFKNDSKLRSAVY